MGLHKGGNQTSFKKGDSGNPKGRPPKTEAVREAERLLAELSPKAVAKLGELMDGDDVKIQAQVALGIVKATIGELQRVAGEDGGNLLGIDFAGWTPEQVLELARSGK